MQKTFAILLTLIAIILIFIWLWKRDKVEKIYNIFGLIFTIIAGLAAIFLFTIPAQQLDEVTPKSSQEAIPTVVTTTFPTTVTRTIEPIPTTVITAQPTTTQTSVLVSHPTSTVISPDITIDIVYKYRHHIAPYIFTNRDFNFVDANRISLPKGNTMGIVVKNVGTNSTQIISNQIPIRILEYSPILERLDIFQLEQGGGGSFDSYMVNMIPKSSEIVWAKFSPISAGTQAPPFYYLKPYDIEAFDIEFNFSTPGRYVFQPGIAVILGGEEHYVWLDERIVAILPKDVSLWKGSHNNPILIGDCSLIIPINPKGWKFDLFLRSLNSW